MSEELSKLEEAEKSLIEVQQFDVQTLPRVDQLGSEMALTDIVPHAQRLVDFFKKLSPSALEDFPTQQLDIVIQDTTATLNRFNTALEFKASAGENARDQLINAVRDAYIGIFQRLSPLISYSLHRSADFEALESKSLAYLQKLKNEMDSVNVEISTKSNEADEVLKRIKEAAAEQGVTQQAKFFKDSATEEAGNANTWYKRALFCAGALISYAVLTFGFHKIPFLTPDSTFEAVQLVVSKVLVFGVLTYSLYFCARNYFSHKHNYVVNKHRHNALITYRALVDAAGDTASTDTILVQAASCIFSPQCTGYSSSSDGVGGAGSAVEFLMKPMAQSASESS